MFILFSFLLLVLTLVARSFPQSTFISILSSHYADYNSIFFSIELLTVSAVTNKTE